MADHAEDRLLLPDEAARYLGLTVATIYSKCSRRELPFVKVGGGLRFKKAALDRLIQRGTRTPQPSRRRKP